MPVANDVAWVLVARRYAVSSTPTADTGPDAGPDLDAGSPPATAGSGGLRRAGASISGVPRSRTGSIGGG